MNSVIDAQNICFAISRKNIFSKTNEKIILKNITFNLERSKILGVAGESGSGKTTLAKVIAGLLKPTSGKLINNFANDWKKRKTKPVQILFQNNGEILNPLRQIDRIVKEAIEIRFENSDIDSAKNIFSAVDLTQDLLTRKGYELSGGEQQRAALARILAAAPEVLILDEPFSAQDPASQLNLLKLFKSINITYKLSMICISHNLKVLKNLCDQMIIMYRGQIVEIGDTKRIFENPEHPYTKFLLRAEDYSLKYDEIQQNIHSLANE